MKFSIIIPFYQAEHHILVSLTSCLNQTYQNFEAIFIDDGSTDNTSSIIESYMASEPRIKLFKHPKNMGTFWARKTGIEAATGEYILFLDSDDELTKDALASLFSHPKSDIVMFQYLKKNCLQSPKMIGGGVEEALPYLTSSQEITDFTNIQSHNALLTALLQNRNIINWSAAGKLYNATCLKTAIKKLAFINRKFILAEDLLIYMAMLMETNSFSFIDNVFYIYHFNPLSSTHEGNSISLKIKQLSLAQTYLLTYQKQFKNEITSQDNRLIEYFLECSFVEIYTYLQTTIKNKAKFIFYLSKYFLSITNDMKKRFIVFSYRKCKLSRK
ncbi:glycosyltransferase [Avibacterium paragallinarum]|uniref:Glycosyltransferase n=1 Tax=Avibacterium paragallinarum TaxID=728 RepID=A0A377I4V4_AVIPA|nr:glycosyltransferase family 2 protein [Avibacterium paragallinarum]STO70336.1 glycosyltransferase [Avibacterium paragallinarum]